MRRSIALFLALLMAFSVAVPAFAEGEPAGDNAITVPDMTEPSTSEATEPPALEAAEPPASETTEPSASETTEPPASEVTEPPASEATETPLPEATETPLPEVSETPVPEVTETPVPEESVEPSPEGESTPTPEPEQRDLMLLSAAPAYTGQVDVIIQRAMDLGDLAPVFTVTLTDEDNTVDYIGGGFTDDATGATRSFTDLPVAMDSSTGSTTYTLTVSAPGFVTYTQKLDVKPSDGITVRLTVGEQKGYGEKHPGVIRIGDVNGNGILNEFDKEAMMVAVDNALPVAEADLAQGKTSQGYTDLNGDGITNLADAEVLAKSCNAPVIEATLEHFVPRTAISPITDTQTVSSGAENLFVDNEQTFTLGRADQAPISAETPVEVDLALADGAKSDVILIEKTNITSGTLTVAYDDMTTVTYDIGPAPEAVPVPAAEVPEGEGTDTAAISAFVSVASFPVFMVNGDGSVTVAAEQPLSSSVPGGQIDPDASGSFEVHLDNQKAVKRVTLRITETSDSGNLASITQVEFVNGMADRIGEPANDIPENVSVVPGSREFTVSWTSGVNITGYEVQVSGDGLTEIVPLTGTTLTVTGITNGVKRDEVLNYTTYTVQVRSVNGAWRSDWTEAQSVTPVPTGRPDKPDNVTAVGGFESVTVSWKKMKDTTSYNLYYKGESAEAYTKIEGLTANSYIISGLDSSKATTYEVYVTGVNEFGESDESIHTTATTDTLNPPDVPRFNLINLSGGENRQGRDHIVSAVCNVGASRVNSAVDPEAGTAWCTVDGNAGSYYQRMTWDDGGFNWLGSDIGLTYTFDDFYTLDTIGIIAPSGMSYGYAKVRWWDEAGNATYTETVGTVGVEYKADSQGRGYYFLRLPDQVTTNKIQIGLSRAWVRNELSVAEVYFYKYDSLKDELMALYEDDLHTVLKPEVTEETLNALKVRIEGSVDEFGNVNPDKELLLREWETAWQILQSRQLSRVVRIHDGITPNNDEHGFGGLNAWQPLGVVAAANEEVTVYVGHKSMTTGSNTSLQLVATQYDAESNVLSKVVKTLQVGPNTVTIPKVWTSTGCESGGALYVQYTGGAGTGDSYAVRVNGGVQVPVLDLYKVTDPTERLNRTQAYVTELSEFVGKMEALHGEKHQGGEPVNGEVDYPYDEQHCILGASDIMLDTMMLSLPAQQILNGCGGSAQTLLGSLNAMENMMGLFYQHKGLNASADSAVDQIPRRHLNIRYMRMFSGAFMYASGDHIGIGYPETAGMAGCGGVTTDNGLWQSGNYFGWGIAHEIGHNINQNHYAIAEITNNYFAVLAQAHDTNDSVRFQYPLVYEKVTSGTRGSASNVFTQLAMYWQLHLAYDSGYNFKTYPDYNEQLANLFWARVDTYARTPSRAPGETPLSLDGADSDQKLMRLCCAAAQKDILDFFVRWGKTPDETTVAYASQFPAETRAIYYVCDDSRRYTIENTAGSQLGTAGDVQAIDTVTVAIDSNQSNKVDITVMPSAAVSTDAILGYEIVRCTIEDGIVSKRTVGFSTESTFSDVIYSMNNRTVSYEVTLVDKYLNRSAVVTTDMVKIQHNGVLDKSHWTVTTEGLEKVTVMTEGTRDDQGRVLDPEIVEQDASMYLIDGKVETVYSTKVLQYGDTAPVIELDFHDSSVITGLQLKGASAGIAGVAVRDNGEWTSVTVDAGSDGVWHFSNTDVKYVSTYAADGLRLTLDAGAGASVSVAEIEVLGPSGDNVEFGGDGAVGWLSADFVYGDNAAVDVIPKGSLVFTGSYKGNAAYNVVMLFDDSGTVVAGRDPAGAMVAQQIILSHVPETGPIQETYDGKWIYWIEPDQMKEGSGFTMPTRARAELYRVNNAQTNEGERLVSDSLYVSIPEKLPEITLTGIDTARANVIALAGADPVQMLDSIALG